MSRTPLQGRVDSVVLRGEVSPARGRQAGQAPALSVVLPDGGRTGGASSDFD